MVLLADLVQVELLVDHLEDQVKGYQVGQHSPWFCWEEDLCSRDLGYVHHWVDPLDQREGHHFLGVHCPKMKGWNAIDLGVGRQSGEDHLGV